MILKEYAYGGHFKGRFEERVQNLKVELPSDIFKPEDDKKEAQQAVEQQIRDKLYENHKELLAPLSDIEPQKYHGWIFANIKLFRDGEQYMFDLKTYSTKDDWDNQQEHRGTIWVAVAHENSLITVKLYLSAPGVEQTIAKDLADHANRNESELDIDANDVHVNRVEPRGSKDPLIRIDFDNAVSNYGKSGKPQAQEQVKTPDDVPYKVKADYRLNSKLTMKDGSIGEVFEVREKAESKGIWYDVKVKFTQGPRQGKMKKFPQLYTKTYFNRKSPQQEQVAYLTNKYKTILEQLTGRKVLLK